MKEFQDKKTSRRGFLKAAELGSAFGAVISRILNAKLSPEVKKKILYENAGQILEKYDREKKFADIWG